ncbi:MAG: hypothetical protein SGILL_004535 [Bacillariaceae sp.]
MLATGTTTVGEVLVTEESEQDVLPSSVAQLDSIVFPATTMGTNQLIGMGMTAAASPGLLDPSDFILGQEGFCPVLQNDPKYFADMLLLGNLGYQEFFDFYSLLSDFLPSGKKGGIGFPIGPGGKKGGRNADTGESALAPGLCTTSYFSHKEIKRRLTRFPQAYQDGRATRGNELGLFRLNDATFRFCQGEEYCGIGLGLPFDEHAIQRPFLDDLWGDRDTALGSIFGDSGNNWERDDLVASATTFLESKTRVDFGRDASIWVILELHRIAGVGINEALAETFLGLQGASLLLAIVPELLVDVVAEEVLGTTVADINTGKEFFIALYKNALLANPPPTIDTSVSEELQLAATGILDSILFAGGVSVSGVIQSGLAAYYTGLTDSTPGFDVTSQSDLNLLALESIRVFPPVLGFSYFSENGRREAPLVGMAGYDEEVYGEDADEFRIRGSLRYYHRRSLNFADAALPTDTDPSSARICPGRSLSLAMITAFWEALDASAFCVVGGPESIEEQEGPSFWSDFSIESC